MIDRMKKIDFLQLTFVALMSAFLFASCEKDDETTFEYQDPCLNWHCSIDEVRTYMKSIRGYKEDSEVEQKYDGNLSYKFINDKRHYCYTFSDEGLIESSFFSLEGTADFDQLKTEVTNLHDVEQWKEQEITSYVEWWSTTLKGQKTDIAIGKSENLGGYMYVTYSYTQFDW